jgi:hypothetical protein
MDQFAAAGRSLPTFVLIPATAAFAVMLLVVLSRTKSPAMRFIVFVLWLRLILSAFHTVTFAASPLGLSWNALASVVIVGLGLLVVRARRILDPALTPLYLLLLSVIASGGVNHDLPAAIDPLVKYTYLAIIILAATDAIEDVGLETFGRLALWPFAIPFGLQLASIALGLPKASEADGSASYIGGFNHEAAFSVVLAAGLMVVCLSRRMGAGLKGLMIVVCCVAIVLANYRTAILAMAPLIGVAVTIGVTRRFVPRQRVLVGMGMTIFAVGALFLAFLSAGDRFADIATIFNSSGPLIKPPATFTLADRGLMSGRALIWSQYFYGYLDGSPIQKIFGLGPDSWVGVIAVYAHNTLVGALYEFGAFGVAAMVFLWTWMIVLAARVTNGPRALLLGGHASFIILNMATMPLWMIEGMIFYGLLCGATVAAYNASRRRVRQSHATTEPVAAPQEAALASPARRWR